MNQHNNPWIALSTYTEDDENRFWGRDEDTANLLTMIQQNECVVVYAASGDGKSSVINAGLSPAMRKVGLFPISIVFNSDELNGISLPYYGDSKSIDFDKLIFSKIAEGIHKYEDKIKKTHNINDFKIEFISIDNHTPSEIEQNKSLWWKLRTNVIQDSLGITDFIPVLIFDQFEEVLRCPWRAQFFKWLENLMKDIPSCENTEGLSNSIHLRKLFKIIVSLRYEYIGELDYWCSQRYFIPQLMQSRYFLKPLNKRQALQIIKSADLNNDAIAKKISEYADIIIESIEASNSRTSSAEDEIPAIILSLTCYVLYEELLDDDTFSLNDVTLTNIIYDYYKRITHRIGLSLQQRTSIERTLISNKGTRLRIPISDPRLESSDIKNLIQGDTNLLSEHILKCDKFNGESYVEFVHDKLADAVHKNMESENAKIKQEKNKNRSTNFVLGIIFVSIIILSCLFTRYSLMHSNDDVVYIEAIEDTQEDESNDIVIEDISQIHSLDLENATALNISSKLDTCRSYRECFKNVCNVYGHPLIYAHNAKRLTFPYKTNYDYSLSFGDNTREVVILYPHNISSISTSSLLTEVLVPFDEYEHVLKSSVFKDVNIVQMSIFRTFIERISYSMHHEHIHILGIELPLWIFTGIYSLVLLLAFYKKWVKYSWKYRICYTSLVLFLTYLIYMIFIEAKWIGWINTINPGIIVILALLIISTLPSIISTFFLGRSHKHKYGIAYTDKTTKNFAIKLRNEMINRGIPENEIMLDFSMYKNDYFDLECFKRTVKRSIRTIIIWDATDIIHKSTSFTQSWDIVKTGGVYKFPIIIGEISERSVLPKRLIKKNGSQSIFPLILVDEKHEEDGINEIIPLLKFKLSPYQKKVVKIGLAIYLLYLIALVLTLCFF